MKNVMANISHDSRQFNEVLLRCGDADKKNGPDIF